MSGNWVPEGGEDAPARDAMEGREPEMSLEQVLEALEQERIASADLNSALIVSEARVAAVERRMREAQEAAASSVEEMRAQLTQQADLAEQYRIEAVEAQTMFDAMQHRIVTLSDQLATLKAAAPPAPASAPAGDEPTAAEERAEVERLAKLLAERETALAATRRARDQWLERLEQSGRERERLRERLVEQVKNAAALASRVAAAEQTGQRVAQLESEIGSLRERVREGDAARARVGEHAAEIERLRSALRSTEEVWERAEADKESLAEELASARQRVSALEESATTEAGRGDEARRAGEALERARQDAARFESECETLRREAAEMRAQIERVEAALVEQAAAREDLQQEIAARTQAEEGAVQRLRELEGELGAAREELRRESTARREGEQSAIERARELEAALDRGERAEREAEEVRNRVAALEVEIAGLRSGREEAVQRAGALEARLGELEAVGAELASWQGRCAEAERVGDGLREELEQAQRERAALADEGAGRDAVTAALLARLEEISAEQDGARGEQARLAGETASFGKEVEAFGELLAEVCAQLRDEQGVLSQVEERLEADAALRDQLAQERARRDAVEEAQHAAGEAGAEERHWLESSDAEVARLREAVAMLERERDALRGGEDELRAEVARLRQQSAEGASQSDDVERLRRQVKILEQERDDLVIGHTTEVSGYRDEIAQHVDAIEQREGELDRLVRECSSLQDAVDEAIGELEGIRGERASVESRLEAMEGASANGLEGLRDLEALVSAAAATAATNGDVEADIEAVAKLAADVGPGIEGEVTAEGAPYVLLFDSSQECRHTIETVVPKLRGARCTSDPEQPVPTGMRPVLAFNLATDSVNPLAILAESKRWGVDEARALVYCVKGDRGVFFGQVEFFPAPCEPRSCAQRLLERSDGNLQRLLAVGEEVDLLSGLREEMGRNRCSTAIAFDGRQAVDLIPMVKPQLVLVDLNLPRGDGLRVASQLRANPETAALRVAMFWSKPIDPLVFRQQAIYAMRDLTLGQEELARKFADTLRHFDAPIVGGASTKARRRTGPLAAAGR